MSTTSHTLVARRLASIRRRVHDVPRTPTEAADLANLALLLGAVEEAFALHPLGATRCPICLPQVVAGYCDTGTHLVAALSARRAPVERPVARPLRPRERVAPVVPPTACSRSGRHRASRSRFARWSGTWRTAFWSFALLMSV